MAINFSDLAKKMDIQGLVKNVKSMVSPSGQTPQPTDSNDVVGIKMAELSLALQELSKTYADQAKKLDHANALLNEVHGLLKAQNNTPKEPAASTEKNTTTENSATADESNKTE